MSNKRRLFVGAMVAGLLCASAARAQVYSTVNLENVRAALSTKLSVQTDSVDGRPFLWAQGKNHTILVVLTGCTNGNPPCEGVNYFAVMKAKPSSSFINGFNRSHSYVKASLNSAGSAVLAVEQLVAGGVAPDNLAENALQLMASMTKFNAAVGGTASAKQAPSAAAFAEAVSSARADELAASPTADQMIRPEDAALVKAFLSQLGAKP